MSAKKLLDGAAISKELTIENKLGIHARPAALFVKTANRFACDIFVEKDGEKINGKSIMGLMMLAAGPGSKVTLHAQGHDALKALNQLEALIQLLPVLDGAADRWPQALSELEQRKPRLPELEELVREMIRKNVDEPGPVADHQR
jgi:phosphocarrier protein HPr